MNHHARIALPVLFASAISWPAVAVEQAATLEEIVVTAQRRSENLQNVPLSITSLTSEVLTQRGITSFVDYGTSVPNLGFGNTGDGAAASRTISIRGVSGDNTTGFYIDETPVVDSLDPLIVDIDRIEVLRGPQGTLYGARSMGGTVRVITKQPDSNSSDSRIHTSVTNSHYGGWNYGVDGAINVPVVSDRLGVRAVGYYDYQSGFLERRFPDPSNPGQFTTTDNAGRKKTLGGSLSALFQVTSDFSITPRILFQEQTFNGFPYADGSLDASNHLNELHGGDLTLNRLVDIREGGHDRWYLGSLDLKYSTDMGTFVSATSYFDRDVYETEDESDFLFFVFGLAAPIRSPISEGKDLRRFVQELRFASAFDGPLQMVAGLYYSHNNYHNWYPPALAPGLDAVFGGFFGTDVVFEDNLHEKIDEPAVYGELSYEVMPALKATVGVRWYEVKSTNNGYQAGIVVGDPVINANESIKESGINPKFSVDYHVTDDDMLYATVAKGFRPGGVTPTVPLSPALNCAADLAPFGLTPEEARHFSSDTLWNYEIGAKTRWLDNRLTANVAGFIIDWQDIQQYILLNCGFQFRYNGGDAETKGVELELQAVPTVGLDMNFGLGYTDARYTKVVANSPLRKGERVFQTPQWTVNTGANYTMPLSGGLDLVTGINYSYIGDSTSANNDPTRPRIRPGYSLVDMRIGVEWQEYGVTFFARNLTDEHADFADSRSIAAELPGRPRVVTNQPRTIGLEFRGNF